MLFRRNKNKDVIERKSIELIRKIDELPPQIDYYGLVVSMLGPRGLIPHVMLAANDVLYARVIEGRRGKKTVVLNGVVAGGPKVKIHTLFGRFEWHVGADHDRIEMVTDLLEKVKSMMNKLSNVLVVLGEIERGYGGQAACRGAVLWGAVRNGIPMLAKILEPGMRLGDEPVAISEDEIGVYGAVASTSHVAIISVMNPFLLAEKAREPRKAYDILSEILAATNPQTSKTSPENASVVKNNVLTDVVVVENESA